MLNRIWVLGRGLETSETQYPRPHSLSPEVPSCIAATSFVPVPPAWPSLLSAARPGHLLPHKPPRVGLIGTGWYGKLDLLRLIQVAPVNVVSLCDVDQRMLSDAADLVATRQASRKRPRTFADYRKMLGGKRPRHRARRHARPLACPADDRRRGSGSRRLRAEADQRRRGRGPGDARRRAEAWPRGPGWHAAPQHAAPHRGP